VRIVLDTNVVLDLVVFRDKGVAPLRSAIEAGRVTLFTSADCITELRRVLDYPEFKLDDAAQAAACDWYVARVEILEAPEPDPLLPRCRDADDQKFLDLAWAASADYLVTKDKALLELARRVAKLGRFAVTTTAGLPGGRAGT
jgi:putative PIN family toxin of toxin-antitoxin system